MDELDQRLMEIIMQLPRDAKMQLMEQLSQSFAPQKSVQEQALGQVFGGY